MQHVFYNWITEALQEIDDLLNAIKPNDPMLDVISHQMFDLETKMIAHMVNQGDYSILGSVEKLQELRQKVKTIKKHDSAM